MDEQGSTSGGMSTGLKFALAVVFFAVWVGLCYALYHSVSAFEKGGWGMWPILLVGMLCVLITIDRVRYLYLKASTDKRAFMASVQKHLMQGDVQGAVRACEQSGAPMAHIVRAGLMNLNRGDDDVQDAVDERALYELPKIEVRTGYLAMIGNVATLLGLLGTIIGLIKSFAGVSMSDANDPATQRRAIEYVELVPACAKDKGAALVTCISNEKATILAKGISEAMNCTAFGLLVGIFSLLAFSVLNGRTQSLLDDISDGVVKVMNLAVGHRPLMKTDFLGAAQ